MSVTVARRPHIHPPLRSIAILIAAAAVAAAVLVSQPWEKQQERSSVGVTLGAGATIGEALTGPQTRVHPLVRPGAGLDKTGLVTGGTSSTAGQPVAGPDANTRAMLLSPTGTKKAGFAAGANAGGSR